MLLFNIACVVSLIVALFSMLVLIINVTGMAAGDITRMHIIIRSCAATLVGVAGYLLAQIIWTRSTLIEFKQMDSEYIKLTKELSDTIKHYEELCENIKSTRGEQTRRE